MLDEVGQVFLKRGIHISNNVLRCGHGGDSRGLPDPSRSGRPGVLGLYVGMLSSDVSISFFRLIRRGIQTPERSCISEEDRDYWTGACSLIGLCLCAQSQDTTMLG